MWLAVVLHQGHFSPAYYHGHAIAVYHMSPVSPFALILVQQATAQRTQIVSAVGRSGYLAQVRSPPVKFVIVGSIIDGPSEHSRLAKYVQACTILGKQADAYLSCTSAIGILSQIACAHSLELGRYPRVDGHFLACLELQAFVVIDG